MNVKRTIKIHKNVGIKILVLTLEKHTKYSTGRGRRESRSDMVQTLISEKKKF